MVYGRVPRGPLAILKETWTGQRDVTSGLNQPVTDCLNDLRDRLRQAVDVATANSAVCQASYAHQYNLRSRDKRFAEDDQVIILDVDASGKMCKR